MAERLVRHRFLTGFRITRTGKAALPESGAPPTNSEIAVSRTESLARKFIVTFSTMFLVPLLVAVFLFTEYASAMLRSPVQIIIFALSVILLGAAGFLAIRSVVMALLRALRDAEAVANGDISRRLGSDGTSEINQLAKHFNQVIGRLEQTVNSFQASRKQTHDLLAQLCVSGSQPGDMTGIFKACLNPLLSMAGLQAGVLFIVSPGGETMKVRVLTGLPEALKAAVIPLGHGVDKW